MKPLELVNHNTDHTHHPSAGILISCPGCVADRTTIRKRFTGAEIAAEYWAAHGESNQTMTGNPRLRFSRRTALRRFATLPHYDEETE